MLALDFSLCRQTQKAPLPQILVLAFNFESAGNKAFVFIR
jgi:hypothetical protein